MKFLQPFQRLVTFRSYVTFRSGGTPIPTSFASAHTPNPSEGTFALSRRFGAGETYQPRDLDEANYPRYREQQKFAPKKDVLELSNKNPLQDYKQASMLVDYISALGKILPRKQTGLSPRSHKLMAKAIRRARALGYIATSYNKVV